MNDLVCVAGFGGVVGFLLTVYGLLLLSRIAKATERTARAIEYLANRALQGASQPPTDETPTAGAH